MAAAAMQHPTSKHATLADPPSARSLQGALREAAAKARALDIRGYEERDLPAATGTLRPAVREALEAALAVLGQVLLRYDAKAEPEAAAAPAGDDFYRKVDVVMRAAAGARRIADLAFMARWELRGKLEVLEGLGPDEALWSVLSHCGSSRRRLLKSLVAVETALCEHEGLQSDLLDVHVTEIDRSVEIRRAYGAFRRAIASQPEPACETLVVGLRGAAVNIAKLIGRDVYEDLRITDRIQLRQLQQGILQWLRGADGHEFRTGLRLWQDLTAFAGLLVQVNLRAELREHDAAVASEAALALFGATPTPAKVPSGLLERLRRLSGRDDRIDELLAQGERSDPADWREPLDRLVEPAPDEAGAQATTGGEEPELPDSDFF